MRLNEDCLQDEIQDFTGWNQNTNGCGKLKIYKKIISDVEKDIQRCTDIFNEVKSTFFDVLVETYLHREIEVLINSFPSFTIDLRKAAEFVSEYAYDSDDELSDSNTDDNAREDNGISDATIVDNCISDIPETCSSIISDKDSRISENTSVDDCISDIPEKCNSIISDKDSRISDNTRVDNCIPDIPEKFGISDEDSRDDHTEVDIFSNISERCASIISDVFVDINNDDSKINCVRYSPVSFDTISKQSSVGALCFFSAEHLKDNKLTQLPKVLVTKLNISGNTNSTVSIQNCVVKINGNSKNQSIRNVNTIKSNGVNGISDVLSMNDVQFQIRHSIESTPNMDSSFKQARNLNSQNKNIIKSTELNCPVQDDKIKRVTSNLKDKTNNSPKKAKKTATKKANENYENSSVSGPETHFKSNNNTTISISQKKKGIKSTDLSLPVQDGSILELESNKDNESLTTKGEPIDDTNEQLKLSNHNSDFKRKKVMSNLNDKMNNSSTKAKQTATKKANDNDKNSSASGTETHFKSNNNITISIPRKKKGIKSTDLNPVQDDFILELESNEDNESLSTKGEPIDDTNEQLQLSSDNSNLKRKKVKSNLIDRRKNSPKQLAKANENYEVSSASGTETQKEKGYKSIKLNCPVQDDFIFKLKTNEDNESLSTKRETIIDINELLQLSNSNSNHKRKKVMSNLIDSLNKSPKKANKTATKEENENYGNRSALHAEHFKSNSSTTVPQKSHSTNNIIMKVDNEPENEEITIGTFLNAVRKMADDSQIISMLKKNFICEYCKKAFTTKNNLKKHLLVCSLQNDASNCIERIKKTVHKNTYECEICKTSYKSKTALDKHNENIHNLRKPYKCLICKWRFCTEKALQDHCNVRHKLSGRKHFKCPYCKNVFAQRAGLKFHIKNNHEGKQLYTCSICFESFKTQLVLNVHKKDHGYACDVCTFVTKVKSELDDHKSNSHIEIVIYRCDICARIYNKRNIFFRHIKTHCN